MLFVFILVIYSLLERGWGLTTSWCRANNYFFSAVITSPNSSLWRKNIVGGRIMFKTSTDIFFCVWYKWHIFSIYYWGLNKVHSILVRIYIYNSPFQNYFHLKKLRIWQIFRTLHILFFPRSFSFIY